jgi:lipopolysaccharide export LptBFGC system permease protein LptF
VSIRESVFEVLRLPPPGIQRFTVGNYKLSYIDFKEGRLEKPSLFRFDTQGRMLMEYHAPLGQILAEGTSIKIVMSRPRYIQHDPDSRQEHQVQAGGQIEIPLELDDVRDPERRLEDWPRDKLEELMRTTHDKKKKSYIRLILHTRWAGAAAPLLLMLVCAPLGIWVRKGSRLAGLGAALPPLLAYFIVFFVTQGLGEKGRMPPVPAAWLPDLVLALPALWLLWGSRR